MKTGRSIALAAAAAGALALGSAALAQDAKQPDAQKPQASGEHRSEHRGEHRHQGMSRMRDMRGGCHGESRGRSGEEHNHS